MEPIVVLFAVFLIFCGFIMWSQHRLVTKSLSLLASRSYVEFAKGEDILSRKGQPPAKKSVGDGYTAVFEEK